jgi:hypothetical protein
MTSKAEEMRERRDLAGSNSGMTYCRQAQIDNALESGGGGRFHNPPTVVGSEPFVRYPAASGPWAGGDNPVEPAIGIDVSFVEACGTPQEVQASIDALEAASELASPSAPLEVSNPASNVSETGDAIPKIEFDAVKASDLAEVLRTPFETSFANRRTSGRSFRWSLRRRERATEWFGSRW